MKVNTALATAALLVAAFSAQAQDSAVTLGKSTFKARCALCHGDDGKGGGEIAGLFETTPSDLTKLSERAGGTFPFPMAYDILASGMKERGHGNSQMPVWGEYFMADALEDRGVLPGDAVAIAAGRILSVVYFLESIQE